MYKIAPDECLIGETGDHSLAHFYDYEELLITDANFSGLAHDRTEP